ncbi:hypothetical protein VTO73DRAFT_7142 [Trametes versicolor]
MARSPSPPPLETVDYDTAQDGYPTFFPGRIEISQDVWTSGSSLDSFRCTCLHVSGGSWGRMITRYLPMSLDEVRGVSGRRLALLLTSFSSELFTDNGEDPLTPAQRQLLLDLAHIYFYFASTPIDAQPAQLWANFI